MSDNKTIAEKALESTEEEIVKEVVEVEEAETVEVEVDEVTTEELEEVEEEVKEEVKPKPKKEVPVKSTPKKEVKETPKEEVKVKLPSKYSPGNYRSDKFLRILKTLSYRNVLDKDGKALKTYGTWTDPSNQIIFKKGVETFLSEEELILPGIQRLIDAKIIYRIG